MSSAAPTFTVLLPTHNRSDVVGFAIRSVLAQTNADFELLVVGDGCTDATAAVVQGFSDARLRWLDLPKAPNFGYANRNIALLEARGELVAFMAHDDLWLSDHLEQFAPVFEDPRIDLAYSRPVWVANDGVVVPFAIDLRNADLFDVWMTHHNSVPAGNVVYRRRAHEWAGTWSEETTGGGDWELWRRIVGPSRGADLAYIGEMTQLHFRADWRKAPLWGPEPLADWLALAGASWWPQELRIAVPNEWSPQEVFAELIADPANDWVVRARAAIPRLLEELAWREAADLAAARTRVADVEASLVALTATLAQAKSDAATAVAAAERAEARASRYRLMDALRRLLRRARLRVRPNPLFDRAWYRAMNSDLDGADPFGHWRQTGAREQRDPNPGFRTAWYLERYPDVAASGMNPLDHYYIYGQLEGRAPAPSEGGAAAQPRP